MSQSMFTLAALQARYRAKPSAVLEVIDEVLARAEAGDKAAFISRVPADGLRAAARALLDQHPNPDSLPLWGVPFAVKDNIDVAGLETTAACPDFAFQPQKDATVIARLKAAGALVVGKTNLDQFATGLNGTRSPYGAPRCVFDADYVSGGSSSGSAVVVGAGTVTFSLGTDTAGSGRVPAGFNNIVGIKPTPGLLSTTGVLPACRSLDCVSIFAASVADGIAIRRVADGFDATDSYSADVAQKALPQKLRVGVLGGSEREFYGDQACAALYDDAIARMTSLGAEIVTIDYAPFRQIAALLYEGPWVAERLAAIRPFFESNADTMDPAVRQIIKGAAKFDAASAFVGQYQLKDLMRLTDAEWAKMDVLLVPSAPTIYKVADMLADPIRLNANLGRYTNFANFLGCCAISVPAGFRPDGKPFGVTLLAQGFHDDALGAPAAALHEAAACGTGRFKEPVLPSVIETPAPDTIEIVVVGAHLTGQPLNHELTSVGGHFVEAMRTTAEYRLFALANTLPPKPGLIREPGFAGPGIEIEVWSLPAAAFGRFVAAIPAPLGVGKIKLTNGRDVSGFLCESNALNGAQDITSFGGWRAYRASLAT